MSDPQSLDLAAYITAPRLSVPSAVALGIALLTATPKPGIQPVRRAATRLRGAVLELQHQWRRHVAAGQVITADPRETDSRVDRAFRALAMRLEALALLPTSASPDVELAKTAYQRLFADGLRFLTLPYVQQWAHCDRLLTTLDEDEALLADIERLAGDTVLTEVRSAQQAYGVALGITTARETVDAVSLSVPLDAVRSAIVAYALQLVAMQSDDPSRLPLARKALAPIDRLRAAQARRAQAGSEAVAEPPEDAVEPEPDAAATPDTPVPVVEDASAAAA